MWARTLPPGDTNDPHFGFHCSPVEFRHHAPGVQDAHQVPKGFSCIDQVDEHDGVGRGDQQLWTDTQQLKIGVQALKRPRDASADALEIEMAHRKRDQAHSVCPGSVEQEPTQEIKKALWRPAKEAEVTVVRLPHAASGAAEQIIEKLRIRWRPWAIEQTTERLAEPEIP